MSEFDDTRATGALRVVAIVQARMGSTRLPGKALLDLAGKTVLGRVVERLRRVAAINAVVVATTDSARDDAITDECRRESVAVFR
ncbi:MAG: NTP transferase domain-containing protein, partial [Candidatus Sulfotelmatobacter sp.]